MSKLKVQSYNIQNSPIREESAHLLFLIVTNYFNI